MNNIDALCFVLDKKSNPLKGNLSFYNFYLFGELSKLFLKGIISLNDKEKILLFKNDISSFFPEKLLFFINCANYEEKIENIMKKLKIKNYFIIK